MAEQFTGTVEVLNSDSGKATIVLDGGDDEDGGNVALGGNGQDGDLTLLDESGDQRIFMSARHPFIRLEENSARTIIFLDGRSGHILIGGAGHNGRLTVADGNRLDVIRLDAGARAATFFPPDNFARFHIDNGPSGGRPLGRLRISHGDNPGDNEVVNILQNGNVGVGTADPRARLHVSGSIRATGDIVLENADCAEEFDAADELAIDPGTVMSLNDDATLSASQIPYDRRVAGVVSGAGSFRPALVLDKRETSTRRVPIALLGKVFCKVDASENPIAVGDLLTTSSKLGYAMKAIDPNRAFGAVLGKALGSLDAGCGLVPVLVTLQ